MNQTRIKNNELGYLGNPNIKRDGIEQSWGSDDIREYAKCMKDPIYFARKYLKVISLDDGLVDFDLYLVSICQNKEPKAFCLEIGIVVSHPQA